MTFTIHFRLPSLNEIIGSSRQNKYSANKDKQKYQQAILSCIPSGHIEKPCNVYLTFYEPDERRDVDNVISAGCKLILDALVQKGTLKDDGRKWVKQIIPLVLTDKAHPRVEIRIEVME